LIQRAEPHRVAVCVPRGQQLRPHRVQLAVFNHLRSEMRSDRSEMRNEVRRSHDVTEQNEKNPKQRREYGVRTELTHLRGEQRHDVACERQILKPVFSLDRL
jgi:hypothetical protein